MSGGQALDVKRLSKYLRGRGGRNDTALPVTARRLVSRTVGRAAVRLFFATDIHGSDVCFRKFVNAGRFYRVDFLVMGGDLSGKELVPIVPSGSRWTARFRGATFAAETKAELVELEKRIANVGPYPMRTTPDFVEALRTDQTLVEETLQRLIYQRTEEWVALAVERLSGTGIECVIGLGNDDYEETIPLFDQAPVRYAREGLMDLGEFTLGTLGWGNPTPWNTHRECSEAELAEKLRALEGSDSDRTIFNIHVPPFDSGLDSAPRLDDTLQVQLVAGEPDMVPVGSRAVAQVVRAARPLLSLHGHIHEGRGVVRWGRTTLVNPGSEYDQGALLGVVIEVKPGKVKQCQLVAG